MNNILPNAGQASGIGYYPIPARVINSSTCIKYSDTDIRSRDVYSWSNSSSADLEKPANDFIDFIKQQSFDYVLYLDNDSKYWANNYLYLKSEDLSEIQPWISMLYSEVVEKINSAVIYPTDK